MLQKLMNEIDARGVAEDNALKRLVNETMRLSSKDEQRKRRDLALRRLYHELMEEDDGNAPLEEVTYILSHIIYLCLSYALYYELFSM